MAKVDFFCWTSQNATSFHDLLNPLCMRIGSLCLHFDCEMTSELLGPCALHRAPVGQGPPGPDWLAISFGFWSGRALATGTAWAGLCLIHHHQRAIRAVFLLTPVWFSSCASHAFRATSHPQCREVRPKEGSPFFFWVLSRTLEGSPFFLLGSLARSSRSHFLLQEN